MRSSGILMHISSLPSEYGIGTLGKEAFGFIDFLEKAGQKLWQILPIHPTSFGDSPYQSFSVYAGNPYFIDFDVLSGGGLLEKSEYASLNWGKRSDDVNYALLYKKRFKLLKKAHERFKAAPPCGYAEFLEKNAHWLPDYALYMALKTFHGGEPWYKWEDALRERRPEKLAECREALADDIAFWAFVQYQFYEQWGALKAYAAKKGVKIFGDMPIYVAYDSVEVWTRPELFMLDEKLAMMEVAGCPPDDFAKTGQLWGNPLYNWERMKGDGYVWWIERIAASLELYDILRIDHFRGFDSYYAIPAGSETAETGVWKAGPGMDFFKALKKALGVQPIIAENLGFLTPSVHRLLKQTGFPGMKVLQFAFDSSGESEYLPHHYEKNCVVYTGTHDNDTIEGWRRTAPKKDVAFCKRYLHTGRRSFSREFIRAAWASTADTAIAQMQDFLELDSRARMNTPATLGMNWRWRAEKGAFTDELARKIRRMTKLYGR